jgi:hypothetical protein
MTQQTSRPTKGQTYRPCMLNETCTCMTMYTLTPIYRWFSQLQTFIEFGDFPSNMCVICHMFFLRPGGPSGDASQGLAWDCRKHWPFISAILPLIFVHMNSWWMSFTLLEREVWTTIASESWGEPGYTKGEGRADWCWWTRRDVFDHTAWAVLETYLQKNSRFD